MLPMNARQKNLHRGSTLDDFLDEEGIREGAKIEAIRRVLAWQLSQEAPPPASPPNRAASAGVVRNPENR
jgi:hypothetical protein